MNLNFELQGGYFIAEFEVTSDFNLHIEKDPIGQFIVYQRTAGGAYDLVADFGKNKGDDSVIDYDFSALVYPKYIQIKSSVNPVVATITTDGEVNELVYQEKSINITSNGEVAISADPGYNGLALVNVKVDVHQSGGPSSEGSENAEELIFIARSEDLSSPEDVNIAIYTVGLAELLPSQVLLIKRLVRDDKTIGVITASDTDPLGNFMPTSSVGIGVVIKKGTIVSVPEFGIETTLNSYDDVCAFIQEIVVPHPSMDVVKANVKNLTYEQVMSIIRTGYY